MKLVCPRCHGKGHAWVAHSTYARLEPCCYPGCMGGSIDCCDGLQENLPRAVCEKYEEAQNLK